MWRRARSACSASACGRIRRSRTAIAWRSIARSCSTRRSGAASARASGSRAAPLADRLLGALGLARALRILEKAALAGGVQRGDALPAPELAQAEPRLRAVLALRIGRRAFFRRLLDLFLALALALLKGSFRRERFVLGCRGRRLRCGGRRLERHRLDAGRRCIAVANLAVSIDPFILLSRPCAGEHEGGQ